MEYFRIRQDSRYLHAPVFSNPEEVMQRRKSISIENADQIQDVSGSMPFPCFGSWIVWQRGARSARTGAI